MSTGTEGEVMRAVVESEGRVEIPEEIRNRLGIRANSILDITEENGTLRIELVQSGQPIENAIGQWKQHGLTTDSIMAELRESL